MSFPNTLTIFINTRIRGYPKIKYEPDMTVPNIKSDTVYFNPLIKLTRSAVYNIPSGYPESEKYTQFFNKNDFNSLVNRSTSSSFQKKLTLEEATKAGIIDNNIKITLDTLFRKNSKFYIRGKPYTIYTHEWINGDWQVDAKSFEKNIMSSSYGQGLYGYGQNVAMQNQLANAELDKFKKEHHEVMRGFAVSTDVSKFKEDYESGIAKGVDTPKKDEKISSSENIPKIARKLAKKKLVFQSIVNLDDEANLSSDPISLNLLYSINRNYAEDIKLNKKVLEPLYENLLAKGESFRIAKENYDKSVGLFSATLNTKPTMPIAVPVEDTSSVPITNVSTAQTPASTNLNNVFKNKKNYDDIVLQINNIIQTQRVRGATFDNIVTNNQIKNQMLQIIVTLEKYRKQFLSNFLETFKLLVNKINAQINYISALLGFYSKLYVSKENYFKSQNSEKQHQNILTLNLIKFDIQCYKNILMSISISSGKELGNNYAELIKNLSLVENFIKRTETTPKNYIEILAKYYNYPGLLLINRYQFDVYMFTILKYEQTIDLGMWKILYRQTDLFLENIKEYIIGKNNGTEIVEGKLSISRTLLDQYNVKYSQQQRDAMEQYISRLNSPLEKQSSSVLDFAFPNSTLFKEQQNDYVELQTSILLCYDLITLYSKISAIKYSREISLVTTKQNLGNILNKIYERIIDTYEIVLEDDTIVRFIPEYLFWDRGTCATEKLLNDNLKLYQNHKIENKNKLGIFKRAMKLLKIKYHQAVDILIPQLTNFGIYEKCRQLVEDDEDVDSEVDELNNHDDDKILTPEEKLVKFFKKENEKFSDGNNTLILQENIIYLYEDAIRERLIGNLPEEEKMDVIESWKVIDNAGGGDCLFLAIAAIFNNELVNSGSKSNNPFAEPNGYYTSHSLRRAVADPNYGMTNAEIDRWAVHRDIENINENAPDDQQDYKRQFSFLLDENGRWIGNDYNAVRNAIRESGNYWGDQTAITVLERIFKIKFIVIDATLQNPIPIGTYVNFQNDDGEMVFGVVSNRQVIVAPGGGRQNVYEVISNSLDIYPNITRNKNRITIAESGHYRVVPVGGNNDIANEFTHYAFLLLTEIPESGVQHYEIITSTINNKFIYEYREIPPYLMYLIFQTQWKFLSPAARDASWFGRNDEFSNHLDHIMDEYRENMRDHGALPPLVPPPRIRAALKKRRVVSRLKKPSKGGSIIDDFENNIVGGAISSRNRYIDINRPNSSMGDSKLSYYVIVDLELYPGESIPLIKQPVIACNLRYEKIRQAFADMFGLVYQPLDFSQRGHVAPSSVKYRKTDEEKEKERNKYRNIGPKYYNGVYSGYDRNRNTAYDTRRNIPYYGGSENKKTRRLF
jgi:hypothetical protein